MAIWKKIILIGIGFVMLFSLIAIIVSSKMQRNNTPIKVLVIFQEDEARILLEKFKQKTGQSYELIRMSSGEANYHLLTNNLSQVDVIIGGPADLHEQLKQYNKLLKYSPKKSDMIPDIYKDPDKFWTGMYMGPLSIGVNTEAWNNDPQLKYLPYPSTYEELLIPELKGRIDLPNPETSGTGYTLLASLEQERGEEEALILMNKLMEQSSTTTFSGITSAQRLAMGEATAAISFLGDQLRYTNSGYSIHSSIPPQAGWEIGAVSILRQTSNKKIAKQLIEFVLDTEAQTYYMNTAFSYPVEPNIEVNSLLSALNLDNMLESYSFSEAAQKRNILLEKWIQLQKGNNKK